MLTNVKANTTFLNEWFAVDLVKNQDGVVVGVVAMRLGDWRTLKMTGALPQNVNYAVKSSHVRELVDAVPEAAKKVKTARGDARPPRFEEIAKQVEAAVGIVLSY